MSREELLLLRKTLLEYLDKGFINQGESFVCSRARVIRPQARRRSPILL